MEPRHTRPASYRLAVGAICSFAATTAFPASPSPQLHQYQHPAKPHSRLRDPPPAPEWTATHTVPVDHFDDRLQRKTFEIRVLGYSKYAKPDGPIFFYAGNEGPIGGFWNNTGLPFAWAAEFGADIVMAEHRYYGGSLPFGATDSFAPVENLRFLRVEQTLADYADFMMSYNNGSNHGGKPPKKVLVMGGSYGGILAALLRQKYPTLFHAAIAASAPIPQAFHLDGVVSRSTSSSVARGKPDFSSSSFYESITHSARQNSESCPVKVRSAFQKLQDKFAAAKDHSYLEPVRKLFNLCQKKLEKSEWSHFMQYLRNGWTMMAMCDYPYATSFLAPLPAHPVRAACELVDKAHSDVEGLAAAVALVYGGGGESEKCLDMYDLFIECADQTGCGTGNDATAWDYQMCADMTIVVASNGKTDMFAPREWTLSSLEKYCAKNWQFERFPSSTSNIVFSNGLLDPWHPGGYLQNLTESVVALQIPSGAHHLDLRLPDKDDPQDVIAVRDQEKALVKKWLAAAAVAVVGENSDIEKARAGAPDSAIYI
eukprot:g16969.t1